MQTDYKHKSDRNASAQLKLMKKPMLTNQKSKEKKKAKTRGATRL